MYEVLVMHNGPLVWKQPLLSEELCQTPHHRDGDHRRDIELWPNVRTNLGESRTRWSEEPEGAVFSLLHQEKPEAGGDRRIPGGTECSARPEQLRSPFELVVLQAGHRPRRHGEPKRLVHVPQVAVAERAGGQARRRDS